jgi:hypothetical protein
LDGLLRLLGRIERDATLAASWSRRAQAVGAQISDENSAVAMTAGRDRALEGARQLGVHLAPTKEKRPPTTRQPGDGL